MKSLPMRIKVDAEVTGLSPTTNGLRSLRYSVEQLTPSGDLVLPCEDCLSHRITSTVLLKDLYLTAANGKVYLRGDIEVVCDGSAGHASDGEGIVSLWVDA